MTMFLQINQLHELHQRIGGINMVSSNPVFSPAQSEVPTLYQYNTPFLNTLSQSHIQTRNPSPHFSSHQNNTKLTNKPNRHSKIRKSERKSIFQHLITSHSRCALEFSSQNKSTYSNIQVNPNMSKNKCSSETVTTHDDSTVDTLSTCNTRTTNSKTINFNNQNEKSNNISNSYQSDSKNLSNMYRHYRILQSSKVNRNLNTVDLNIVTNNINGYLCFSLLCNTLYWTLG